jgi:mannose-6-phosphate isomerase
MGPLKLAPNLISHQYLGGAKIRAFRGLDGKNQYQPEEWIGSTISLLHDRARGVATTLDGRDVRRLIADDPAGWLGPGWPASDGDSGVLLKLLDAAQRLPVHAHPDRAFAKAHLASKYGKTEAWLVLDATPGAGVYVGWSEPVDPEELALRRDQQDSAWMLGRLNRVEVVPGMAIFVPAGTMHAIEQGVFIAEIQEPTDYSIVVEWSVTTRNRDSSNLGLGWEIAQKAISCDALLVEDLQSLIRRNTLGSKPPGVRSLLVAAADPFFRLEEAVSGVGLDVVVPADFGAVIVLYGSGAIVTSHYRQEVSVGQTLLIPHGLGDWRLSGDVSLLIARPAQRSGDSGKLKGAS